MGRVLLYVTTGCSHCVRAKKLLDSKNIPYVTIDLAEHPERKQEMVMASGGRKTVPQIFFNYEHIGVSLAYLLLLLFLIIGFRAQMICMHLILMEYLMIN